MLFDGDTNNGSLKQRDHIREYLYTQQIKKQKLSHDEENTEENTEEYDSEKCNSEENNKLNKIIYNFIEKNILKKFKNLLSHN